MADRDDGFLDHGGEEFNADADEFKIPEDSDGDLLADDDFLSGEDDELDLSAEDIVDESEDEEFDFLDGDERGELDEEESEEYGDDQEYGEEAEYGEQGEYDESIEGEEASDDASLGWKAWTGLACAVLLTTGGLIAYVMPMFEQGQGGAPSARQERLPEPPPAPPASTSNQVGTPSTPSGQGQPNTPVSVSPFPESEMSPQERLAAVEKAEAERLQREYARQLEQQAREQQMAVNQQAPQATTPNNVNQSSPVVSRNSGNGGNASGGGNGPGGNDGSNGIEVSPFTLDTTDRPVIGSPSNQAAEQEAGYMALIEDQRQAFTMLMSATEKNGQQLTRMDKKLDSYQQKTNQDVKDLDVRVERLEKLIKQGENVNRQTAAVSTDNNTNTQDLGSVPKSPAEIKSLQRKLNEHNYRAGTVDGIMGRNTRDAIKRLQKEHGLPENGWLNKQTLAALKDPKRYSGTYPKRTTKVASAKRAGDKTWYVRGVTPTKAVVYRPDGLSYAVKVGSEIPGMGQVTQLDTEKLHVVTAKGVITRRK